MNKKGSFIIAGLVVAVLGVAIGVISVLIFFLIFKVNIDLQMREQYVWNKVEELPLSLLSMDMNEGSFVSRMNKVYYGKADEKQLRDEIDNITSKQLFYFIQGGAHPLTASINIAGIEITKKFEGCSIEINMIPGGPEGETVFECKCKGKTCTKPEGSRVASFTDKDKCNEPAVLDLCIYTSNTRVFYSAKYPFPLSFNATEKMIDELSYEATQII